MKRKLIHAWILDSGGAGRGAWQGGVIHEFMIWTRQRGCYPQVMMGASAGGYAAADVATGTEATVMKGWTRWGNEEVGSTLVSSELKSFWGLGKFRLHLRASIRYVMGASEVDEVFNAPGARKLLVFTTRVRNRKGHPIQSGDVRRFFLKSVSRKWPRSLKYQPKGYLEEPVVFATHLPEVLQSEQVRPLNRENYHSVIEASCLVPLAMGDPVSPGEVNRGNLDSKRNYHDDEKAVFMDGGYTLKMPMALFEEDARFQPLAAWALADKTLIFGCDPRGNLWETSARLRRLNRYPRVAQAIEENRLLVIYPDHKIEAGFLCYDNAVIMHTFRRGQEQANRLLRSDRVRRFFEEA